MNIDIINNEKNNFLMIISFLYIKSTHHPINKKVPVRELLRPWFQIPIKVSYELAK